METALRNFKFIKLKIAEADGAGPSHEQVVDLMPVFLKVQREVLHEVESKSLAVHVHFQLKTLGLLAPPSFFQGQS